MKLAGIPYCISIDAQKEKSCKCVLKPLKSNETVNSHFLSYGEKNSISLMLFSLEAVNFDLIVLDDPVSSFDTNKKFAILFELFGEWGLFKNKTVLLFTHDFDVIANIYSKNKLGKKIKHSFCYLYNSDKILNEITISSEDIQNTVEIWENKFRDESLFKLIRVINFRKYVECFVGKQDDDCPVYDVLSSLTHAKDRPSYRRGTIPQEKSQKAFGFIKKYISDFDYFVFLNEIKDISKLKKYYSETKSCEEKLQLFRLFAEINGFNPDDDVFFDFVTETYHTGNNELLKLDDYKFEMIPKYIMDKCDDIMNAI